MVSRHDQAATAAGSLSRRERGGVRGYKLSIDPNPLTPTLSPLGRGSPAVPQGQAAHTKTIRVKTTRMTQAIELPYPSTSASERRLVGGVCFAHLVSHYYITLLAPLFVFVREDYAVSY